MSTEQDRKQPAPESTGTPNHPAASPGTHSSQQGGGTSGKDVAERQNQQSANQQPVAGSGGRQVADEQNQQAGREKPVA